MKSGLRIDVVKGNGVPRQIQYALVPSPCGRIFVALAPEGVVYAGFAKGSSEPFAELKRRWPEAVINIDKAAVSSVMRCYWKGSGKVRCRMQGTPFQLKVWRALSRIPTGTTISYSRLGKRAGVRGAQAIGQAVAANPVALLIPCHRVIREDGSLGNYHWGPERKMALLELENH